MFRSNKKRKFWPSSKKNKSATDWIQEHAIKVPRVTVTTPIASMGSCFAREIKDWLVKNKYNYLLGNEIESHFLSHELFMGDKGRSPSIHASVAWERVYNTFTMRNIIDYSFNGIELHDRFVEVESRKGKKYTADLVRSRMIFRNLKEARSNFANHLKESRRVLMNAEVLILTLGLIEIWQSEKSGLVIGAHPGNEYKLPPEFKPRVSELSENLDNLKHVVKTLNFHNENLKIIITVSPVHLLKTERDDTDVISASCYSKSLLRVVADQIAKFNNVYYFPSYEIATICSNIDEIPLYPDNHHVSREVVCNIMTAFMKLSSKPKLRLFS